jgi:hypothetical protein
MIYTFFHFDIRLMKYSRSNDIYNIESHINDTCIQELIPFLNINFNCGDIQPHDVFVFVLSKLHRNTLCIKKSKDFLILT